MVPTDLQRSLENLLEHPLWTDKLFQIPLCETDKTSQTLLLRSDVTEENSSPQTELTTVVVAPGCVNLWQWPNWLFQLCTSACQRSLKA